MFMIWSDGCRSSREIGPITAEILERSRGFMELGSRSIEKSQGG
jgi:hypothetical protein